MNADDVVALIDEIKFDKDPAQSKFFQVNGALDVILPNACARANLR